MRSVSTVVSLPEATNDTLTLIKAACLGVAKTWRDQGHLPWRYSKAGIVTTDLLPLEASTRALIGQLDRERSAPSWRHSMPAIRGLAGVVLSRRVLG